MNERTLRIGLAFLVVVTLTLAVASSGAFPSDADLSDGWRTPILAFELARTEADLAFLAGLAAEPVRAAMDAGHRWDTVFPFAYGALLAAALASVRQRWASAGIGLALLAIPLDLVENHQLVAITDALRHGQSGAPWLPWLMAATWLKWGSLAAALGCYAAARGRQTPIVSLLCSVAPLLTVAAGLSGAPLLGEAMALVVVLGITCVALRQIGPTPTA